MSLIDTDNQDDDESVTSNPATTTPRRALVGALFDAANRAALEAALAGNVPNVIVVETSAADLAKIVARELSSSIRQARVVSIVASKKNGDADCIEQMLTTLGSGCHFLVVTHDPVGLLPGLVKVAADITLRLPRPDGAVMRSAVARLTGKAPPASMRQLDLGRLDADGLLAALRPGSSAAQCLGRLKKFSATVPARSAAAQGPRIEDLPLVEPVRSWADGLIEQLRDVETGAAPAQSLRHAVLEGPPGTGKTLVAHAISSSSGWPLHVTSVGEWFATSDGNLGGVSRACRTFFDGLLAEERAIGFIDEIDALPSRAALKPEDLQWWSTCITLVLGEIDRVRRSGKPIQLVAATNFYSHLDRALVRPERLERQVSVHPPRTEAELAAVFRYHLQGALDEETISIVARLCADATPASIGSTVEAARAVARKASRGMIREDLITAALPIDMRPPHELRQVAIHEAGHVVAAHVLGFSVASVSIMASGPAGGVTRMQDLPAAPDRKELEGLVMVHLGGRAADLVVGQGANAGAAEDLATATNMISDGICRFGLFGTLTQLDPAGSDLAEMIEGHLNRLLRRTVALIKPNAMVVTALADALLAGRILDQTQINQIVEASLQQLARQKNATKTVSKVKLAEKPHG